MAIGKLNKSFKRMVSDSENQPLAYTSLAFSHEFLVAGENTINFDSLNVSQEWVLSGRVNPNYSEILNANLRFFKNQVVLTSSSKGIIQPSQYSLTSSSIVFRTFLSEVNEVFEVQVLGVSSLGRTLVDGKSLRVEDTLYAGSQDFPIGVGVARDPEQIIVFRDGQLQKRNSSNQPIILGVGETYADYGTHYYMLDPSNSGASSVIRFNESLVTDSDILVVSVGSFIEKPTVSMMQEIERLGTQIDLMIPYVASSASVPESTFRTAPNNLDLLQFSNEVDKVKYKIGDFVYSPALTIAQFQGLRDDTWVAVDGSNISGSDLAELSGYTVLPVMLGWFVKINN
jgi:hypothetical protein